MGVEAAPPVVDSSSKASSDGEAKGHIRIIGASFGAAHEAWSRRAGGMVLSVRLARSEMNSMPSGLMAPHVLIAMMMRRMLLCWGRCHRTGGDASERQSQGGQTGARGRCGELRRELNQPRRGS